MNIAVVGSGYVGLVLGACLAETGNVVIGVDLDQAKVDGLNRGKIPIYEPGLTEIVETNLAADRLSFTTDLGLAVRSSDVIFIAVGTPSREDGSADLQHVLKVAGDIGLQMNGEKVVVTKSTVPVGTADLVRKEIQAVSSHTVHVCSNPEFLKEGSAVDDLLKPDRVVIGVETEYSARILSDLYAPFVRTGKPLLLMDVKSAEITKYAANAMLATRISFMNSIALLCEKAGANVDLVRKGVGSDGRIGSAFLFPGVGYGGSCFPKDVRALIQVSDELGVGSSILKAVEGVNENQKMLLLRAIVDRFGDSLVGRRIAIWGLAFKPNTDDMREAPSLVTIGGLLERGAEVLVHDPVAMDAAREYLGDDVVYCDSNYETLDGADALVIHTEWHPYRNPSFERMLELMKEPAVFDGRNLYGVERMAELGFDYISIGRPFNPSEVSL